MGGKEQARYEGGKEKGRKRETERKVWGVLTLFIHYFCKFNF